MCHILPERRGWVNRINYCRLFNAKSFSYIYILNIWFRNISLITFLNVPELIFSFHTVKWFYLLLSNTNNSVCYLSFGHCWRSRDELISNVLLWTPTHGRAKAGRPARTYIQQLCKDTGCCPEDLPRAMNDREEWRERVRDIRATSTTWWWWFIICLHTV